MLGAPSETVVQVYFQNVEGTEIHLDTGARVAGVHPDLNRHHTFPLAQGLDGSGSLAAGRLANFTNSIYFNVFDECEVHSAARGRNLVRKQRRFVFCRARYLIILELDDL